MWTSVDRAGDRQLSTFARVTVVGVVCLLSWRLDRASPDLYPRSAVEASTLLWFAIAAAGIAMFHTMRGPEVQGRERFVWDGVTLALGTAWTVAALITVSS